MHAILAGGLKALSANVFAFSDHGKATVEPVKTGYLGANGGLNVIFFERDNPMADVFAFYSDMVFVSEKSLSPTTAIA